jgi:hypothetical protein
MVIKSKKERERTTPTKYVESFLDSPKNSDNSKYDIIFPPNIVFITSPITGKSPDYTIDQFKTIFSRFVTIVKQYNEFSDIRRQREDEELEDFPPIFILDIQFDIVIPRLDHISTYNRNRLVATMNFISAQLGLTEAIAKELTEYIGVLKKGFDYDPMAAVPIHSE